MPDTRNCLCSVHRDESSRTESRRFDPIHIDLEDLEDAHRPKNVLHSRWQFKGGLAQGFLLIRLHHQQLLVLEAGVQPLVQSTATVASLSKPDSVNGLTMRTGAAVSDICLSFCLDRHEY